MTSISDDGPLISSKLTTSTNTDWPVFLPGKRRQPSDLPAGDDRPETVQVNNPPLSSPVPKSEANAVRPSIKVGNSILIRPLVATVSYAGIVSEVLKTNLNVLKQLGETYDDQTRKAGAFFGGTNKKEFITSSILESVKSTIVKKTKYDPGFAGKIMPFGNVPQVVALQLYVVPAEMGSKMVYA